MNAKTGPIVNPRLVVICPTLKWGDFKQLNERAKDALDFAKPIAKSGSYELPVCVLFEERALDFRFNITAKEVAEAIRPLKKILRDLGGERFVVFNVMERRVTKLDQMLVDERRGTSIETAHNRGYLLDGNGGKSQSKRVLTIGDDNDLSCHWSPHDEYRFQEEVWNRRRDFLYEKEIPFPKVKLKGRGELELRICGDVRLQTDLDRKDTCSLVPAADIDPEDTDKLSRVRRAVIVHDHFKYHGQDKVPRSNVWVSNLDRDWKYWEWQNEVSVKII